MPNLDQNRIWDSYSWLYDGDEWNDQAAFSKISYEVWKADLVASFIACNMVRGSTVLEIAPGHGRWTPFLSEEGVRYIGVDMNENCVEFCRKRFSNRNNVEFYLNDGLSLPMIQSESINFVWSFDSFVHLESDVTDRYLSEFARVLFPGGYCCIHHSGNATETQRVCGWRSAMTTSLFASLAAHYGLEIVSQSDSWGPNNRCNTKLFGDYISVIKRP